MTEHINETAPTSTLATPAAFIHTTASLPSMTKISLATCSCLLALSGSSAGVVRAFSVDVEDSRRTFLTKAVTAAAGITATSTSIVAGVPLPALAREGDVRLTDRATAAHPLLGKKAPTFTLPNSSGTSTTLDDLVSSKKWTVLYFFPAAFTSGCTLEARNFQRDLDTYRRLNAQVVGISVDAADKQGDFCAKEGLDFYMLSDVGGKVSEQYGSALKVPGIGSFSNRQTYIIDRDGYFRHVFTDVESRIPRHSQEVIEKLEEEEGLI